MDENAKWYVNALNTNPNTVRRSEHGSFYKYHAEPGRKYTKIVMTRAHDDGGDSGRSVHAFIVNGTGEVLKAAGWNAPAKGVRYVLPRDAELINSRMEFSGGYLYQDALK